MQYSSCPTPKPKFMDPIISDHLPTLKMMKNDGRSKPSEIIDDEAETAINTKSNGKATRLPRQRGNRPRVLKMEEKKFSKNTDTASISTQMNNEIYTFTLINPEGKEILFNNNAIQSEEDVACVRIPSSRSHTANRRRTSHRLLRTILSNIAIPLSQSQMKNISNVLRARYTAPSRSLKNSTYANKRYPTTPNSLPGSSR